MLKVLTSVFCYVIMSIVKLKEGIFMPKTITVSIEQTPKTFTRDGQSTSYFSYACIINGISVAIKPADSTSRIILESEFSSRGK